ncbi:hypothetical protein pb186bvf_010615 [Paramecium bursaria]
MDEQPIESKLHLQMQIIQFQDANIQNMKSIILEKDQELKKKDDMILTLKSQVTNLQNQIKQSHSHEQENSNIAQQYSKCKEELQKLKTILNQNTMPDLLLEILQLKEQVVCLQAQKTKSEMDFKEAQLKLIQTQSSLTDLQRESIMYKSQKIPQYQYPYMKESNMKLVDEQKNMRKFQIQYELQQLKLSVVDQQSIRRIQQLEEELQQLDRM